MSIEDQVERRKETFRQILAELGAGATDAGALLRPFDIHPVSAIAQMVERRGFPKWDSALLLLVPPRGARRSCR